MRHIDVLSVEGWRDFQRSAVWAAIRHQMQLEANAQKDFLLAPASSVEEVLRQERIKGTISALQDYDPIETIIHQKLKEEEDGRSARQNP